MDDVTLFAKFKYAKNVNYTPEMKFAKYSHSLKFHDIRYTYTLHMHNHLTIESFNYGII